MWKLVIEDDEGKRTAVPLTRDDYTIGREEGNTIRLTERNVSRRHGRIRRQRAANGQSKDVFILEDLRSYNGLFVNGLRVAHQQDLQHGDLIQIGDYRLLLQDDAVSAIESAAIPVTTTEPDAKATIPMATAYRGQLLTERPNRLVMLVGPTPGVEYPLDRERITVGRAEDAIISVNHNSVSRLHCEIHAFGDGRFEIVDKGSSNGVRVNGVELRRSLIEAGDVIELGDVRFKFVGAGQVFVPGPNESQQLTAISDREADLGHGRRSFAPYLAPIFGAAVVGAGLLVGVFWYLNKRAVADNAISPVVETEAQVLADAKASCTIEDCERSHLIINSQIPETSPWRDHADFAAIESIWADGTLRRARSELDAAKRRQMIMRVLEAPKVDAQRKTEAQELLSKSADIPTSVPTDLPVVVSPVTTKDAGAVAALTPPPAPPPRPQPTSHATVTSATTSVAAATTKPEPTTPPAPKGPSAYERAVEAAKLGNAGEVRRLLENRVRSGHGTIDEARLVKEACKAQGDTACRDDVKNKYQL